MDITKLTITQALKDLKAKKYSSAELTKAYLDRIEHVEQHHLHLPADEVVHRQCAALVRHMDNVHCGHRFEKLHGKVRGGSVAAGTVVELPGTCFRVGDQVFNRFHR